MSAAHARGACPLLLAAACAGAPSATPATRPGAAVLDHTPDPSSESANGVRWWSYGLRGPPCVDMPGQPEPPIPQLSVVTNDADYRKLLCRASDIDFGRFRLLVYRTYWGVSRFEVETVVREGADLVLVLRRRPDCDSYGQQYLAVVIPAGSERVRSFIHHEPPGCAGDPEGYAY